MANQHASTLLLGLFVTLSREIGPYLVLLIRRTDVNPEALAAEPSSLVLAGGRVLLPPRTCAHAPVCTPGHVYAQL